jgi:hypothetical protein
MFQTYLHVTHMSSGNGPRETGTSEEWWGITSGRLCERVGGLDVFIVLSHSPKPVRDRIPERLPGAFPVGVDLFPYTREEVTARVPSLLLDAVTRSRWRYTRGRGSPPP